MCLRTVQYASTLGARPFTLSLREPSAVQPDMRPVTFVEFEGTLAIGAAAEDNATEEDEGITMLMLFTLNAGRAQLRVVILSPSRAMLQIDAARAVQKCVTTCGSRAIRRCDVWQEKKAHSAHPRPYSTPVTE